MANIYDMTDTWNSGATTFQSIKMTVTDTASASDSSLLQLLNGGTVEFDVSKLGHVSANTLSLTNNVTGNVSFSEDVTVGGNIRVYGDVSISGNTTIIDTTELTISDKNVVLANGSPSSSESDGAGFTIDGADATLTYRHSDVTMVFNTPLAVNSSFSVGDVKGVVTETTLDFGENRVVAKNLLHPFLLMGV